MNAAHRRTPAGTTRPGRAPQLTVFAGTRPEIVKLAPVVHALRAAGAGVRVVATGQHHDRRMAGSFFADLGLPPDESWELTGDEAARTGALLAHALTHFAAGPRPDLAVVQGDTWTVPLVALAARRHGVPVAHVEAGLRSHNPLSPEENNRTVAADLATVHLAPTEGARDNLLREGVPADAVHVVGNTVLDVLRTSGVAAVPVERRRGVLVTAHRPGTVDAPERLAALVATVRALADSCGPVVFPLHPRTADRLAAHRLTDGLRHPGIELLEPQPHGRMLELIATSALVATDSGGLQEEAGWFGVPAVVLRESTPRPEGVALGQAALAGLDPARAVAAARRLLDPAEQRRIAHLPCPYGDGRTGERIAALVTTLHRADRLALREPGPGAA
ncbi:UDP-N-acetylglucosamine 2-epimerase (non-hydrolysing) [Kitasatospora sp. SolWspMP-SS2h]|uniref:non-hydrolyzing UDP-N-acetylglucosamine 2-epimerase n=1 Tax=Kitasatospora sp. SolWspMP-SS2h TaxID=1305729 RepID=UPI000DB9BC64|nr:UDP-N-acetylglucosamine 2-epimerase (non-hydrolyzing) [Kitasatospora sp. SolWspMP-SS2h]RAJ45653.1 UDP-N-acetylglucosamine 2-epimerase (non-hydrolysing) [Kitasatospora sp. SolWspMP-SS2h]